MTVQSTTARADYLGNGVTTLLPVPFYFLDNTHIKVLRTDRSTVPPTTATLVLGSDYVVTGAGNQQGGSIQTTVAATGTQTITILRNVPFTQLIHYVPNDPFPAATHELALDQLTMEVQELNEQVSHALTFPTYEPVPPTIPAAGQRASTVFGFDANGNITYLPMPASVGAGNLVSEGPFVAGTNFTAGVTTTLTLSRSYGIVTNVSVHFDSNYQGPDQYTLNGAQIIFTAPIPVGVSKVYIIGGTTVSIGITGAAASITDYGTPVTNTTFAYAVASIQSLGGGLLRMGSNSAIAPPANYAGVLLDYDGPHAPINLFQESGETIWFAQKVLRNQINTAHAGTGYSVLHVENHAKGTGTSGPTNADFGLTVSLFKQGFGGGSAVAGELDGIYVVVRNDGSNSDTTAILGDVGLYGTGFAAFYEAAVTGFVGGVTSFQIDAQSCVIDTRNHNYVGHVVTGTVGALTDAYLAQTSVGATWTNWFRALQNSNTEVFSIDALGTGRAGRINLFDGIGGKKTLRCDTNALSVLGSGGAEIFRLDNIGQLVIGSQATVAGLVINGTPVSVSGSLAIGSTTAASATAGGATLPAAPSGFINGFNGLAAIKIPYYNA